MMTVEVKIEGRKRGRKISWGVYILNLQNAVGLEIITIIIDTYFLILVL